MKLIRVISTILKSVPKLDPIVGKVTENIARKRVIKSIIRLVQILLAAYLLYKGLIEPEEALEIINGK